MSESLSHATLHLFDYLLGTFDQMIYKSLIPNQFLVLDKLIQSGGTENKDLQHVSQLLELIPIPSQINVEALSEEDQYLLSDCDPYLQEAQEQQAEFLQILLLFFFF